MMQFANVVVYSYQYLLDPKVAAIISKEMQKETVVVFDEAHNIDNVCIEALSVSVRRQTVDGARRNLNRMRQEIDRYVQLLAISSCLCDFDFVLTNSIVNKWVIW
jgi:DNA excision repair protein ERCC-2